MSNQAAVYFLSNSISGVLFVGVTSDLFQTLAQFKSNHAKDPSRRSKLDRLVHVELYEDFRSASSREMQLKWWPRLWKLELIEQENPDWHDLWDEITCYLEQSLLVPATQNP